MFIYPTVAQADWLLGYAGYISIGQTVMSAGDSETKGQKSRGKNLLFKIYSQLCVIHSDVLSNKMMVKGLKQGIHFPNCDCITTY